MKRGDVVTIAASGGYGKPRPAVIVQIDALPAEHASVIVCQMASDIVEALDFRVTIEPTEKNGLRARSQIMADKPAACEWQTSPLRPPAAWGPYVGWRPAILGYRSAYWRWCCSSSTAKRCWGISFG